MKIKELMTENIIVGTHVLYSDGGLDEETLAKMKENNDWQGYDYVRLFQERTLQRIAEMPTEIPVKVVLKKVEDGVEIVKGVDYVLPLIYLSFHLTCRMMSGWIPSPYVIFRPSIDAKAAHGLSENECRQFIDDMEYLYTLHASMTDEFYKRYVGTLSDEACDQMLRKIESIDF